MADQFEVCLRIERVLATLIRLLGDFELAEDHTCVRRGPSAVAERRLPENPRAWLVNVGRHNGIDRLRRHMRFLAKRDQIEADLMSDHR